MGPSKRKSTPSGNDERSENASEAAEDTPPVKRVRIGDAAGDDETVATTPADRKVDVATKISEDEVHDPSEKRKRQGRKRKKKCYAEILQQMEFYFSDANIAKSNFMQVRLNLYIISKYAFLDDGLLSH